MRIVKNNKGFSMIELLATVTILGILSVISIGAVQMLLDKSKNEFYSSQEENMILAAQTYFQNHNKELPKSVGLERQVSLKTLVNSKYIDNVKTKSSKNCNIDNSYVEVIKLAKNNYKYNVNLDCGSEYKTNLVKKEEAPEITYDMPAPAKEKTQKNVNVVAHLKGSAADSNTKLFSYSYIIYAAEIDSNEFYEVKNTGNISIRSKQRDLNIKLDEYLPAKIKIEIIAINENGKKTSVTTPAKVYKDNIPPACQTLKVLGDNTTWDDVASRTIKVICNDDEEGTGCQRPYYTKVFTEEAKQSTITIEDKNGNSYDCPVNVYIDRTQPTLKVNIRNGSATGEILETFETTTANPNIVKTSKWYNETYENGIYIEYVLTDNLSLNQLTYARNKSGLTASSSNLNTYNTPTKVNLDGAKNKKGGFLINADGNHKIKYTLKDGTGNTVTLELNARVDKTAPTCGTITALGTVGKNSWYISNMTFSTKNGSDAMSGHSSTTLNTTAINSSTTGKKITLTTKDTAGNKCTTSKTYKVDLEDPICGTISATGTKGNNDWYTDDITLKATDGSDTISGHSSTKLNITSIKTSTKGKDVTLTTTDESGRTCTTTKTYKLDKGKPTCGTIVPSGTKGLNDWYVSKMTFSTKDGSDNISGHSSTTINKTAINASTTGTEITLTTKDEAGNKCTTSETYKVDIDKPYINIADIYPGERTTLNNKGGCVKAWTTTGTCYPTFTAHGTFYYDATFQAIDPAGGSGIARKETIWNHNGDSDKKCGSASKGEWVNHNDCRYRIGSPATWIKEYKRAVDKAGNAGPYVVVYSSITW